MSLTPRQIANRANAQKSTGPKTAEGKAKSSLNAVKHGLAAQHALLPNEDAEAYKAVVQGWIDDLQPADTLEMALVDRAAMADWRLKRCVRSEHARLASKVRHAAETHDRERFARAEELGNRSMYDPLNRCIVPPVDPDTLRRIHNWRAINPAVVVRELESFAEGVDWMIKRWERIAGILDRENFWHYPEKFEAIKLLGQRPDDALNVEIVGKIFNACRVLHPEPWDITADIQQAALGCEGRPIYAVRAEWLEARAPRTSEEAFDILLKIIGNELTRLRERRVDLAKSAAMDRQEAEARAMFDDSKEAVLALRYETVRDRELRRALADLQKKRKEEAQAAKRVEKEIACETEAVEEKPVRKRTTTRRTAPPNEAKEPRSEMSTRAARGRKTVVRCEESSPGKFDGSRPIKEHAGNQGP